MPFEPFHQTAGLGGRKSFIKRSRFVRAEIVLYQGDLRGVRKPSIRHVLEQVGVIHRCVAIRDRDVPPAVKRCEQHEDIGGSVAFVLVIGPRRAPGPHRDRHARFLDQLFGGLVQADQRADRVVRTVIYFQHLFHRRDEGGVAVRGDDPLIFQMRFEKVFFNTRPIVLSLVRSTIFNSTTLSSNSVSVHRDRPLGGGEQAKAISLASAAPSKMRLRAEFGECFRLRTASKPSSTNRWRVRATVARLVSSAVTMRLSLQPSPASETSALSRIRAFRIAAAGCLPLLIKSSSADRSSRLRRTTYFLTATSDMFRFPAPSRRAPESQKTNSESMTAGTSPNHPSCFLRGTAIQTPDGEVRIEDLRVGDLVLTVRG